MKSDIWLDLKDWEKSDKKEKYSKEDPRELPRFSNVSSSGGRSSIRLFKKQLEEQRKKMEKKKGGLLKRWSKRSMTFQISVMMSVTFFLYLLVYLIMLFEQVRIYEANVYRDIMLEYNELSDDLAQNILKSNIN